MSERTPLEKFDTRICNLKFLCLKGKQKTKTLLGGRALLKKFKWQYRTKVFNQNQVGLRNRIQVVGLTKVVLTGDGSLPVKKQNIALIILSGCPRCD